jgi:hypothetical protein
MVIMTDVLNWIWKLAGMATISNFNKVEIITLFQNGNFYVILKFG